MKAKALIRVGDTQVDRQDDRQNEIDTLTAIYQLSQCEISDGDRVFEEEEGEINEINHDGVKFMVGGSDDEFAEEEHNSRANAGPEPGEIPSSDDDDLPAGKFGSIASKVVKVNKQGATTKATKADKFQHLKDDPDFADFLNNMLDAKLAARAPADPCSSHDKQSKQRGSSTIRNNAEDGKSRSRGIVDIQNVQTDMVSPVNEGVKNTPVQVSARNSPHVFKSPSDTTIYTPGLRKACNESEELSLIEKISNFVESIHLDGKRSSSVQQRRGTGESTADRRNSITPPHMSTGKKQSGLHDSHNVVRNDRSEGDRNRHQVQSTTAERVTDQLFVQAEKFKAKVEAPKGNNYGEMLMPYDYGKLRSKFVKPEGLTPNR